MAEFCALGGTAVRDDGSALRDPRGAAEHYASTVDGVAVLPAWGLPVPFLREWSKRVDAPSHLVLGGWGAEVNGFAARGVDLDGVMAASRLPLDGGPPAWERYLASFARSYPSLPPGSAVGSVGYRNGVEAVATALERVGGDEARLNAALAAAKAPTVPVAAPFDRNRQLIASIYLSRLGSKGAIDARTDSVVGGVEQTFGGIFGGPGSTPTATSSACDVAAKPPPWAR
jgi:hypothetical protein